MTRDNGVTHGRPLWLREQRARVRYRALAGEVDTEVAIVGGGMTGMLTAHAFASAGVSTVVLEGALVGRGSTAASSALLLKEPDLRLERLAGRYGMRAAGRIWALSAASVDGLVGLLRRLRVPCGLESRDAVHVATRTSVEALRREWRLRRRRGFAAEWLTPADVRDLTGLAAPGGIRTPGAAQFDPYAACVGLAEASAAAGARVFERSPVRRVVPGVGTVRVHTTLGSVTARRVIIATGYATPSFRPLAGRFKLFRTYVVTTERLSAAARRDVGLSNVLLWDTDEPYHYARWTGDGRLILGGEDTLIRPGVGRRRLLRSSARRLRQHFEERWPALMDIPTACAWEGRFAVTADSLPFIGPHRRYPLQWFALGYGGNGLTFAHLAAQQLLERWRGTVSADHALFAFDRLR